MSRSNLDAIQRWRSVINGEETKLLRMYPEDDAAEIESLRLWINRRIATAGMGTIRYFADMWRKAFGTVGNMPEDIKTMLDGRVAELKRKSRKVYVMEVDGKLYGKGPADYMRELFVDYVVTCGMYGKTDVTFRIKKVDGRRT